MTEELTVKTVSRVGAPGQGYWLTAVVVADNERWPETSEHSLVIPDKQAADVSVTFATSDIDRWHVGKRLTVVITEEDV